MTSDCSIAFSVFVSTDTVLPTKTTETVLLCCVDLGVLKVCKESLLLASCLV